MAVVSCQQVVLIFMVCIGQGHASRHQFMLAMTNGAPAPGPAPGPAPMGSPAAAPAGPCECRFEDFCSCGGALAYLDCISKTCAKKECNCGENDVQFSTSCGKIASECQSDLDIDCSSSKATCEGKFHQAENGIIGLNMEFDSIVSEAFCGPTGRCTGTVKAAVKVHKPAKGVRVSCALEPRQGHLLDLQQRTEQNRTHLRKPAEAPETVIAFKEEPKENKVKKVVKKEKKDEEKKAEEEAEKKDGEKEDEKKDGDKNDKKDAEEEADVGNQEHFGVTGLEAHEKGLLTCTAKVESDDAVCTMDMPPRLKPEGDIEGLCRLVKEENDEIITKDAWFVIRNPYTKPKAEPKMAEPPAKSFAIYVSCSVSAATALVAAAMTF